MLQVGFLQFRDIQLPSKTFSGQMLGFTRQSVREVPKTIVRDGIARSCLSRRRPMSRMRRKERRRHASKLGQMWVRHKKHEDMKPTTTGGESILRNKGAAAQVAISSRGAICGHRTSWSILSYASGTDIPGHHPAPVHLCWYCGAKESVV